MSDVSNDDLFVALISLHSRLAERECASTSVIRAMAHLGKPLPEALAAGMLTIGGFHAPLEEALQVWRNFDEYPFYLSSWTTVPGFGSSWYSGEPDPAFDEFRSLLPEPVLARLDRLTEQVRTQTGKQLYPNAAMYTAIAADMLGYDGTYISSLLVRGRVDTWCLIWAKNYRRLQ